MKYMGSKNRHAKQLLPIILENRGLDQWYVEPFCGGCNIIDKVGGKRLASDIHYYLIEMWKALVYGNWQPPDRVSNIMYDSIRREMLDYNPALVGFVGFGCSYAEKWFGGYARGNSSGGHPRNYCGESKRNVLRQVPGLGGVLFQNKSYCNLIIPPDSIIYCDPPYRNTTGYRDSFDHDLFWQWCRDMHEQGHKVFISEYVAPDDFVCVWSKVVNNTLVRDTGSKQGIERLFVNR